MHIVLLFLFAFLRLVTAQSIQPQSSPTNQLQSLLCENMFTALVTGSSRGIGLGVIKEFLKRPNFRVVATCRNPSDASALQDLKKQFADRLLVFPLDVTSEASHQQLQQSLASNGIDSIDILLANAGVLTSRSNALAATAADARLDFETNVIGAMLTVQSYSSLVLASRLKIFAVTSSILGSFANADGSGGVTTYRMSKAAINMFMVGFAADSKLQQQGGKVLIIHPGWVQTEMGGSGAAITVDQSTAGIATLFDIATSIQTNTKGTFPPTYNSFYERLNGNVHAYAVYNGDLLTW